MDRVTNASVSIEDMDDPTFQAHLEELSFIPGKYWQRYRGRVLKAQGEYYVRIQQLFELRRVRLKKM